MRKIRKNKKNNTLINSKDVFNLKKGDEVLYLEYSHFNEDAMDVAKYAIVEEVYFNSDVESEDRGEIFITVGKFPEEKRTTSIIFNKETMVYQDNHGNTVGLMNKHWIRRYIDVDSGQYTYNFEDYAIFLNPKFAKSFIYKQYSKKFTDKKIELEKIRKDIEDLNRSYSKSIENINKLCSK